MSHASTITGRIKHIERTGTSSYGNPAYTLTIELATIEGTPVETGTGVAWQSNLVRVPLMSNSSLAYAINNPEYRDTLVSFTLTPAGRIRNAQVL